MSYPDAKHAPLSYDNMMMHSDLNQRFASGHTDNFCTQTNLPDNNAFDKDSDNHINHVANLPCTSPKISPLLSVDNDKSTARRDTQFTSRCLYADSNVLNLSTIFSPTAEQLLLLEKGLSFIPMPHKHNHAALHRDVSLYHRHLKIADYFSSKTHNHVPFTFPSTWEPAWSSLSRPVKILLTRDTEIFHRFSADPDRRDNLSKLEREALKRLLDNQNIIVKPADKG